MNDRIYIVQKGDTLSKIARDKVGDINRYLELAGYNKINNPDLIQVGQKILIPDKFDKPLTFEEIPSNNKKHIIDNYSPNYNYLVEGDKIYYSRKGHNDYWVDISDNDVARKNLYNFLNNKYQFRGYEDNEKQILQQVNAGTYNYADRSKRTNTVDDYNVKRLNYIKDKTQKQSLKYIRGQQQEEKPNSLYVAPIIYDATRKNKKNNSIIDTAFDYLEKGKNWIKRQTDKILGDDDKKSVLQTKVPDLLQSKYQIIPESYTGTDTIYYNRQYIVPESIDLNNATLGTRNRGDYTPLNTEGGIITAFDSFRPAKSLKNSKGTYMGVDKNGHFKTGNINDFDPDDLVTRTYENELVSFAKDANGKQKYKNDAAHGNRSRSVPVVNMIVDGKPKEGSLNILTDINQKGNTYGNITGGRLVVKAGNEYRLISGSIETLENQIENIKKRHKISSVKVYTLDNGSYNRGLRTKDRILTASDLRSYDNQNNGGGNFMYLNNSVYKSDTIRTPNIRTKQSESYKKRHSLINERKGILLHHTGFTNDPSLKEVTKLLTTPGGNSSHVIIGENGNRIVLADTKNVTFHAGKSRFNNRNDVNDFMIGIEFQGDTNKKDLTDKQIQSAIDYMLPIIRQNKISLENITTHQNVRQLYNEYAKAVGDKQSADKPDINYDNYVRIINALKQRVYYNIDKPNKQQKTKSTAINRKTLSGKY